MKGGSYKRFGSSGTHHIFSKAILYSKEMPENTKKPFASPPSLKGGIMQKDFHYYIFYALVSGNCGQRKMSMVSYHSNADLLTDIIHPYYHQVNLLYKIIL